MDELVMFYALGMIGIYSLMYYSIIYDWIAKYINTKRGIINNKNEESQIEFRKETDEDL